MDNEIVDAGEGAMFKNKKKTRDSQPGYSGSAMIDGKDYWVSCWVNKGKPTSRIPGETYMSLKFTLKEEQAPAGNTDFDDEIPF